MLRQPLRGRQWVVSSLTIQVFYYQEFPYAEEILNCLLKPAFVPYALQEWPKGDKARMGIWPKRSKDGPELESRSKKT